MFRLAMGVTRLDRIRIEYMRGAAGVERIRVKLKESRFKRYNHVLRNDGDYFSYESYEDCQKKIIDTVNSDMKELELKVEDAKNWKSLIGTIRCVCLPQKSIS